jgi:hypothetical protein
MLDFTNPAWVEQVAAWHDKEASGCRKADGPSSPELADMHETTARMLRALMAALPAHP